MALRLYFCYRFEPFQVPVLGRVPGLGTLCDVGSLNVTPYNKGIHIEHTNMYSNAVFSIAMHAETRSGNTPSKYDTFQILIHNPSHYLIYAINNINML